MFLKCIRSRKYLEIFLNKNFYVCLDKGRNITESIETKA